MKTCTKSRPNGSPSAPPAVNGHAAPPFRVPGQPAPWRSEQVCCKMCYYGGLDSHGLIHCLRNAPACNPRRPLDWAFFAIVSPDCWCGEWHEKIPEQMRDAE
jgi:hypothetical protein